MLGQFRPSRQSTVLNKTTSQRGHNTLRMQVVAATQRDTGRRVALKVVFLDNPRLTEDHASVLRDEVTIIESLRHPNVVTFDCVMEDPVRRQIVIAEEILLGGTLTEELGAAAANNDDRLLAHVFRQLLSALAHMHRAGIVHRDLKPENVMFRAEAGQWAQTGAVPVIIDFGMSTRVQPGSPPVVGLLGSPGARAQHACVRYAGVLPMCAPDAVLLQSPPSTPARLLLLVVCDCGSVYPTGGSVAGRTWPGNERAACVLRPVCCGLLRPSLRALRTCAYFCSNMCRVCRAGGDQRGAAHSGAGHVCGGSDALHLHRRRPPDDAEAGQHSGVRALRGLGALQHAGAARSRTAATAPI